MLMFAEGLTIILGDPDHMLSVKKIISYYSVQQFTRICLLLETW